jgi:hypothetical protein
MGQQLNKTIKRRRLKAYLARRKQREKASAGANRSLAAKKVPAPKKIIKKAKAEAEA